MTTQAKVKTSGPVIASELPPIKRGDSTLAERARVRLGGIGRAHRPDTRTAVCPHCGRTWQANSQSSDGNSGRVMGFLVSAANNHAGTCAVATAEERRAIARLDMRRWAKLRQNRGGYAPQQQVTISFRSRGYGNEPIFADSSLERFGSSLAQVDTHAERRDVEQARPVRVGSAVRDSECANNSKDQPCQMK